MRFVERGHIDCEKWDRLVDDCGGMAFSKSFYLDAVAENWCIYVDDAYSKGIAVPFVERLGKRTAYTPLFLRCLEWFGGTLPVNIFTKLKEEFTKGDLSISPVTDMEGDQLVYQEIPLLTVPKYNEQAKRMIRKFENSDLSIVQVDSPTRILEIIAEELPSKVSSVNRRSLVLLESLVTMLHQNQLVKMIEVRREGECVGGAFFIEVPDRIIYLKSAFRSHAKKNGAMYKIMDTEINKASAGHKSFDFGGSRVDGVRRFNLNMGGIDHFYSGIKWDGMPLWYKGIKALNDKLRKK
jgi:hypothetical protein